MDGDALPWAVVAFVVLVLILFVIVGVTLFGGVVWVARSSSPRAVRLRQVLGFDRFQGPAVGRFMSIGEAKRKRAAAAEALAKKQGGRFDAEDATLLARLARFALLAVNRSTSLHDIARWTLEHDEFTLASEVYEHLDGPSTTTHTLVLVEAPELQLPSFEAGPDSIFDRIVRTLPKIEFPDDGTFTSTYYVCGADQSAIRALFDGDVRREMLKVEFYRLECRESTVLFVWQTSCTELRECELFVDQSSRLFAQLRTSWLNARRFH